jgi:hypothetical protein
LLDVTVCQNQSVTVVEFEPALQGTNVGDRLGGRLGGHPVAGLELGVAQEGDAGHGIGD